MSASADSTLELTSSTIRVARVLHLHAGNMIGGIESMLRTLAECSPLCPEFKQEMALAFDGPFAESIRNAGMKVHALPFAQLSNPLSVLKSRRALRALIEAERFDAVISHSPWCQVVYGPSLKAANVSVIYWMHNAFDGHWLQRFASRHVPDFAICNSKFSRSTLFRVYPNVPSTVIHYPVESSTIVACSRDELRRAMQVRQDTVVILMASRMEAWKGHFNLFHAAARMKPTSDWTIWVAGAPQTADEQKYYDAVVTEVKRLYLQERVRFLGHRSDVPALMRAADIFCQPNAKPEPFGIVFIEALQAEMPVVTFAMGGPNEILDADSGFLIPPGDIPALALTLQRLIDDVDLRQKFRESGPARARFLCDPAQQLRRLHQVVASVSHGTEEKP